MSRTRRGIPVTQGRSQSKRVEGAPFFLQRGTVIKVAFGTSS